MSENVEERVQDLEREIGGKAELSQLDEVASNLQLTSEAFRIIQSILNDLIIRSFPDADEQEEFASDLDRLDQLASLLI